MAIIEKVTTRRVLEATLFLGCALAIWYVFSHVDRGHTSVQAAMVSGTVAISAALFSWLSFVYYPRRIKRAETKLHFVERQMSELYGPLCGLLISSERAYETVLQHLELSEDQIKSIKAKHTYVDPYQFFDPAFNDDQQVQRLHEITSKVFLQNNRKIRNLIEKHYHLVGPGYADRPKSFDWVLEHIAEFEYRFKLFERTNEKDVTSGNIWPITFASDVRHKLELLSRLQQKYRAELTGDTFPQKLDRDIQTLKTLLTAPTERGPQGNGIRYVKPVNPSWQFR